MQGPHRGVKRVVAALGGVLGSSWLLLPVYLALASTILYRTPESVPTHHRKEEWVAYGSDIRTAESFRTNLTRIVELAREREETLVLMTFAWYVPDDYTKQRFHDGQLPYTPAEKTHPIEIWGSPENVVAGIRAHNAVVREVAAAHPDLPFVDQEQRIPRDGAYFGDICHFSERGLEAFVEGIAPIARDARRRAAP